MLHPLLPQPRPGKLTDHPTSSASNLIDRSLTSHASSTEVTQHTGPRPAASDVTPDIKAAVRRARDPGPRIHVSVLARNRGHAHMSLRPWFGPCCDSTAVLFVASPSAASCVTRLDDGKCRWRHGAVLRTSWPGERKHRGQRDAGITIPFPIFQTPFRRKERSRLEAARSYVTQDQGASEQQPVDHHGHVCRGPVPLSNRAHARRSSETEEE